MAMNVEAEIRELKRRVSELEGPFGFLTRQVKGVHKDVLAFQARAEQRFNKVESEIRGLRADMPGIVGDALRATQREGRRKARKAL